MNFAKIMKAAIVLPKPRFWKSERSPILLPIARQQWNGHLYVVWLPSQYTPQIVNAHSSIYAPYTFSVDDFIADDWLTANEHWPEYETETASTRRHGRDDFRVEG